MPRLRSQLRATPITVRWVALALVLVGGTALTVGALSYARARTALIAAAETRLELLGRDLTQTLYRKLMGHAADITTWARLETMVALTFGDVDKQVADMLRETIGTDDAYVALGAYDREGRRIAVAGDAAALPVLDASAPPAATQLTVLAGAAGRRSLLRLDTPVANPRRPEERIGTLAAMLDPGRLLDGIAADRLREGTTVTLRAAEALLATAGSNVDADGGPVLATAVAMPPLRGVAAPRFTIATRQATREALAAVTALRTTLVRSALVVIVLSGIAGGLFAWRLSVPIRRLTASVEHVAAHGQPEPITDVPRGGGEVGVLTDAFNAMLQRLAVAQRESVTQSRLALLGEIAASIVHDVRTPLSVLKTSAQLLGSAELSPAERRDLAGMIASEVDRLNRVVTNLADLGRRPPATRTRQALPALVERTLSVLRPWARARGIALESRGGTELLVDADADQLLQALLNVVHNAAQASPTGGRVRIEWRAEPPWAVVAVTDGGPGFSTEALERAFSSFFTTKPDGTGLGLVIAKQIVEAHDGTISVSNREHGGACVSLRLPLAT
jgi:signal transduction histidine kinase